MQQPVYTLFLRLCVYIFADLVHRDVLTLLVYGAKQMIAMREGEGGRETDRERRRGGEREGKEEEGVGGGGETGKERGRLLHLPLHCHHQNDSCVKISSDESRFNVSLTVRNKVTRQVSTDHNF